MILMQRLQVLIYVLNIVHVLSKNELINTERNETVNGLTQCSPRNYDECLTSMRINDSKVKTSTNVVEFLDETPELLLNDHLDSNDANLSIHDTTVDDFRQIFENVFAPSGDQQNDNSKVENELFTCNGTDGRNVQNLTVDFVGTEWIYLTWQLPCENLRNETFIYAVDACSLSAKHCFQTNVTDIQLNVTHLDPCSEYNFTVTVVGENWQSHGVSTKRRTSDNITAIGDIRELVAHTTVNTITLSWDAPENYSMCVRHYVITQCLKGSCNNIIVVLKEYTSKDLEPCEKYFFTIKSATDSMHSNGFNITLKTNSPKSTKPQQPTLEASAFSLFVHWQPPETGAMCVQYYRVTISPQLTTKQITGTNITINDLYACTPYTIYINAVDEDNNDGEMLNMQVKTTRTVPKSPILDTKDPIVTTTSIMLPWKIEKGNSNCTLKSLKAICNSTTTNGHGYEVTNGNVEVIINSRIQDEFLIVNAMVENVSPFTTYICWAYVINEEGNSAPSNFISVTTLEDIPSAPPFNVINVTYSQFIFVWESPTYLAGYLLQFEIVFEGKICFPTPNWCEKKDSNITIYFDGSTFIFEYHKSKAYTNYRAKIKAQTNAGWGNYSSDLIFQTPAGVPGMVSNFSYSIENSKDDKNILNTVLTWGFPCFLNGILDYFNVIVYGTRPNYALHSFTIRKYVSNDVINNDRVSVNLHELKAEYNYTFNVSAKVEGIQDFGISASHNILYPAGIPSQPDEDYIKSITIDPANARRSTTTATLLLPLFPDTNGDIVYYSIIVSRMDLNIPSSTRFNMTNRTWPNISSWEEAMLQDFMIPYQATRLWWDPYPNHVADYGDVKAVKYTLGEDTNCQEISSNTNKRVYCNGPLKPNTWYHVRMRAFTRGGYSDSTTFLIKTNAEINIALVSGVVFGILFLGILTTMMLLIRKCSPQVIIRRFLHSGMSGSPVPAPLSKKKFIAHCQQLIDNPGKLSNEFQLLQTLSVDLQMPTNTACLQANKKKNRYSDILPYDFSRVKLEIIDDDPNTDYINASFVKGYSGGDEYIACQGPKEETTFDFWRMVEQYNVNMVVMLTELIEKGKEKCHQYFPAIRETFKYENMTIKCISELDYRSYTQRTLILQKENKRRYIIHLHFKEWPDHDVPEDFDPIIHFCQIVRRNIAANKGYIVIHCSAGIGRTGTLIAIDILLQHVRDNRKLDVFGTVYRLRHHRINMVQKESQYAYIYNCIKQVLRNPYCLKNYKPPPMDPLDQNTSKKTRITPSSNINLVNSFEIFQKYHLSSFPWSLHDRICFLSYRKYQKKKTMKLRSNSLMNTNA